MLAQVALALIGLALVLYALTGGADFGAGVWHLLAFGPRKREQRAAVLRAIGPIWEANHVWIIFAIILLLTCFPPAFGAIMTAVHDPVMIVLLGIVLRGSAFAFRSYGMVAERGQLLWGAVFGVSSLITPLFLGLIVGALSAGARWNTPFAWSVGLLALLLFGFLAAVYLTCETEGALREDFRLRAIAVGLAAGVVAFGVRLLADSETPTVAANLAAGGPRKLFLFGTEAVAGATLLALLLRRFRLARFGAAVQVAAILVGWGLAMDGMLIVPDVSIEDAAAPPEVLRTAILVSAVGGVLLAPALYYLMRVFKGPGRRPDTDPSPAPDRRAPRPPRG